MVIALSLAACQIEGGVARTPPTVPPTGLSSSPTMPPATMTPDPTVVAEPTSSPIADSLVRIGLLNAPGDLLPYFSDSADERATAPMSQLIFPAPLLAHSYRYTTTGVLQRVPSLENGDVTIDMVDVFLDQTGQISAEPTETITQVQQLSVTYRWNPELRWADGTPVTAADSIFAYEIAQQISLGQEADTRLALIESYEQIDDYTTRAILRPDYTDPAYLTTYWTPLPRHLMADLDLETLRTTEFALLPIGYGPYMIERRDQGSLRLIRNPHYPNSGGPDAIIFLFRDDLELLRSSVSGGSLDLAVTDALLPEDLAVLQQEAETGAYDLKAVPGPIWEHLDFNLDVPLFQDIRVRRAIAHAIDRQAMVDQLQGGLSSVLNSWIVPDQWAAAPIEQLTIYPYNPAESRRLLDEAGLLDSDGDGIREAAGQPITLTLTTTAGSPLRQSAAAQIQANLAEVGIALNIEELPTEELYSLNGPLFRRSFQLALFAWIAETDPRGWERWSCTGVPSESNGWTGNNFPGWCFFEADKAIRTATTALERAEREQAYVLQQRLFTQELPVLPLFQRVDVTIVNPTLAGVESDPTAPITWNVSEWARR
ncbi:MAG: peptide ABC transporter substrate-binding protein [Oscillochloris sp.]|nr:peptide ABC transporter substrate-binding protein [Oscillochloris sp.]